MARACAAYPNSAPNLSKNPGIHRLWCEQLTEISGDRALRNLNYYIMTQKFFPEIADIVRLDLLETTDQEQQKENTVLLLEQKEAWLEHAVPPPKHIIEKWGRK
jgi:hypothetical protein